MKGVIYARYSSDNQREESIEGQLRECKEYAERNDITILGTYIDRALSAKTDNRPEFQHMIKDSTKGLFDVVIVWKLDRFARNRYDSARYKNLLKKNGVKVISARENISEGSEGIILEAMLEGYAEYYSAELSEKVIAENHLTAMMVTHNMNDAIVHGNRLIMMSEGRIILDIGGEEKKQLTVEDLLQKFEQISGEKFASDKALLS